MNGFSDELGSGTSQLLVNPKTLDLDMAMKEIQKQALKMNSLVVASFAMIFTTGLLMM